MKIIKNVFWNLLRTAIFWVDKTEYKFHPDSGIAIITVLPTKCTDVCPCPFMVNYTKEEEQLLDNLWHYCGYEYIVDPLACCQALVTEYDEVKKSKKLYKWFLPKITELTITYEQYKTHFWDCILLKNKMIKIYNR